VFSAELGQGADQHPLAVSAAGSVDATHDIPQRLSVTLSYL